MGLETDTEGEESRLGLAVVVASLAAGEGSCGWWTEKPPVGEVPGEDEAEPAADGLAAIVVLLLLVVDVITVKSGFMRAGRFSLLLVVVLELEWGEGGSCCVCWCDCCECCCCN